MKCLIDPDHFRPVWQAIQPPPPDPTDPEADFPDEYYTSMVRIEVSDGMFRARSPYGSAECPADIEKTGVLFVKTREFVDATLSLMTEPNIDLEATNDWVRVNFKRLLTAPETFWLFEDVETAYENWDDFTITVGDPADLIED